MHPRVSHTGIEAPAKLAVSGCSSDIMCAVTPTPEGGSVLAYDRHPNTGTLADLHRWLSHEGDPLYIRMPYANGCIYPQGAALLAYGALLHGSTKSWCFSGAELDAHTARVPPPLHRRRSATGDEEAASTGSENPPGICEARRAPPGAGRDPLEEMFGVRMVDHESLFVVFFETFGSCDSQLDCFYCVARY
ncbi:hypothetical protein PAPYR_7102 [Paratrimastix pyriformis]|uniref:Uncharacterized protein n=1 Tax=Paratrimastix pyriformis TaxID=342808 RepID=A0ABQ8UF73_9EUKA|nr:hypothetical protein PAPYR_7102 [Paratrimastix pyriformis]